MKKTTEEVEAIGRHMASQHVRALFEMHNLALEEAAKEAEHVPVADRNPALVRNEIVDRIRAMTVELPPVTEQSGEEPKP